MKLVMAADRKTDDILGVVPAGFTPAEEQDLVKRIAERYGFACAVFEDAKPRRQFAIGDRAFRLTPLGVTASEVEVREVVKGGGLCDLLVFDAKNQAVIPLPSGTLVDVPPKGVHVMLLSPRTLN